MDDKNLDADVLREMMELRTGGKPGSTGNSDAIYLAKTFAKYAEMLRVELNKLGANIGKLDGWAGVQMHDALKMMRPGVDRTVWATRTLAHLDVERTFPEGLGDREALNVLEGIYDTIITGIPATTQAVGTGPANMAKSLGSHRVLHFKDADATLAYREEFGYGNAIGGMWAHFAEGARVGSLMKVLGPNPENMFMTIADVLQKKIKDSPTIPADQKVLMTQELATDVGAMRHALDIAIGIQPRPGSVRWADIGRVIRAGEVVSKLGGALISSVTDPISVAASAQFRGSSFFTTFARQMGEISAGRTPGERGEINFLIGEGFDGFLGHISNAMASLDTPAGLTGKVQEIFFRLNGLQWWTDVNRAGAGRIISAEMGMRAKTAFDALPENYKHVLGLHGIDEARWKLIRKANLRQVNGTDYVTPDRIREIDDAAFLDIAKDRIAIARKAARIDEARSPQARAQREAMFQRQVADIVADEKRNLELDVLGFFADETNYGIIEVDPRARRTMTWGTRPGTMGGEAMRFIMQFKGWPIAFTQRFGGRMRARRPGSWDVMNKTGQSSFWSETMPHIGTLLASMTLGGYAAMTAKDMIKGYWPPRDPGDMRTWIAAAQQGGAWGIYGDFLFSQTNRFGGGFLETAAGPAFGTIGDLINIGLDARDAAVTGGEDTFGASKAFSSIWANAPGANLFYVKPAMDYLWLNSLREQLSPGYLRRQKRMRETMYGQERLFPQTLEE
jgi:hypothetical protein